MSDGVISHICAIRRVATGGVVLSQRFTVRGVISGGIISHSCRGRGVVSGDVILV